MKIIKLKKSEYTNFETLLRRVGLVDEATHTASPNKIHVNETTYKEMKKLLTAAYKKENPYLSKSRIEYSVGIYLLNLGPAVLKNEDGGNALPKGVAIVES